jgi:hypothetical protein
MTWSDEEIEKLAAAIVPAVYTMKCPYCLALPTKRCREQVSQRQFADREQPHMQRITKAVTEFMRAYVLAKTKEREV